ncbi:MAG TPA: hypothetical protein PLP42_15675 [Acidobacteriota bacterium]|jgi:hypothetical protein|nr:hypothetical protein [Acidobacteriota bacterium]
MYLRFKVNIACSRHRSHPFRFTHTATGTFPEHKFYCAVCEIDGETCSFDKSEISSFQLVDDGINNHEGHIAWLESIAAEIGQELENCEEEAA